MTDLAYRGPLKPGPPGSYEELALRQLRLRRMIDLLVHGASYREIARDLGVARSTVMRMAPEAARRGAMTRGMLPLSGTFHDRLQGQPLQTDMQTNAPLRCRIRDQDPADWSGARQQGRTSQHEDERGIMPETDF